MTQHKLYLDGANELLQVVYEMRDAGLRQGVDFDYAWHVTRYQNENFSFEILERAHGVFKFYNESWATLFALKYL